MLRPTVLGRRNTAAPFSAVPGVPAAPVAVADLQAPESAVVQPPSALSVDDVRWNSDAAPPLALTDVWAGSTATGAEDSVAPGEQASEPPTAAAREEPRSEPTGTAYPADRDDWFAGAQEAEDEADASPDDALWESEWNRWEETGRPESLQREATPWPGATDEAVAAAPEAAGPQPDRAAEVLEAVARMVRSREIVVSVNPGASTESVLASILASLLSHPS